DAQFGEACDDGADNSLLPDASCRPNCQPRFCGDKVVDAVHGETCDDGNNAAGDGCTPDCGSKEVCGNLYPDLLIGEQCDDDTARRRVVVFGGYSNNGGVRNDTWEWDGTTWQQASPATSPPKREGAGMAYDAARKRVVLFGGRTGATLFADTWEWDGTTWQL